MVFYHYGLSLGYVILRVLGPQFGETLYITKVNGAGKDKSNSLVTKRKNSDPLQFFSRGLAAWGGEDSAPTQIFPNFWN